MKLRKNLILLGLLVLPASLAAQTPADRAAAEIDRDAIEGPVRFLADDLLEGRGPASRGARSRSAAGCVFSCSRRRTRS